jgi:hypothetical protein
MKKLTVNKLNKYLDQTSKLGIDKDRAIKVLKSWIAYKKSKQQEVA